MSTKLLRSFDILYLPDILHSTQTEESSDSLQSDIRLLRPLDVVLATGGRETEGRLSQERASVNVFWGFTMSRALGVFAAVAVVLSVASSAEARHCRSACRPVRVHHHARCCPAPAPVATCAAPCAAPVATCSAPAPSCSTCSSATTTVMTGCSSCSTGIISSSYPSEVGTVVSGGCPGGCNASPAPVYSSSSPTPTYNAPVESAPAPPAEAPKPADAPAEPAK